MSQPIPTVSDETTRYLLARCDEIEAALFAREPEIRTILNPVRFIILNPEYYEAAARPAIAAHLLVAAGALIGPTLGLVKFVPPRK